MSNTLAIAATTGALVTLLGKVTDPRFPGEPEYSDAEVTCVPFDEVKTDGTKNQLNVFLFQIVPNATWRGLDASRANRLEDGKAPLALTLHYLLTAYGKDNDDLLSHGLLGRAMSLLHDYAILAPATITAAISSLATQLGGSDLATQIERVRVTMQVLSIDEMSKLWTMFQAKFRVSAVYTVSVVLIDSALSGRPSLPALSRGLQVIPSLIPPVPTLSSLTLPKQQPSARLGVPKALLPGMPATDLSGDLLTFNGVNLDLGTPQLVLQSQYLGTTMPALTLITTTSVMLSVKLPVDQDIWPVGVYLAIARLTTTGMVGVPDRVVDSNALPFLLAPRVLSVTYSAATTGVGAHPALFTVKCSPQVWATQRAKLLIMDREILSSVRTAKTDTLTFPLPGETPPAGTYYVRLRIDDVDSLLVSDYSAAQPGFDTAQQVTVT